MKIVIDLPEEVTEWFKERAFIPIKYYTEVEEAMEKAEPLSEILAKISAEINTPNRGTCDYFIVDRIEEIISEYREGVSE